MVITALFLSIVDSQATDYTRMAQEIGNASVSKRDGSMAEAQSFMESTKEQKYPSFFGIEEKTKALVYKSNPSFKLKESGMTCRASTFGGDGPKARYQGDKGLYIFVSLSLPDQILKALSKQAKLRGGNLVIQGLVKNSFIKTHKRLEELGIALDIDPTLFERFDVKRVPTFVLTKVKNGEIQGPFDKVTGNVSLESALELFATSGEMMEQAKKLFQINDGMSLCLG